MASGIMGMTWRQSGCIKAGCNAVGCDIDHPQVSKDAKNRARRAAADDRFYPSIEVGDRVKVFFYDPADQDGGAGCSSSRAVDFEHARLVDEDLDMWWDAQVKEVPGERAEGQDWSDLYWKVAFYEEGGRKTSEVDYGPIAGNRIRNNKFEDQTTLRIRREAREKREQKKAQEEEEQRREAQAEKLRRQQQAAERKRQKKKPRGASKTKKKK